jgi:hypothetical protein
MKHVLVVWSMASALLASSSLANQMQSSHERVISLLGMKVTEAAAQMAALDPTTLSNMKAILSDSLTSEIIANDGLARTQLKEQFDSLKTCGDDYKAADFEIWDRLTKMQAGTWTDLSLMQESPLEAARRLTDEEQAQLDALYESCKSQENELKAQLTACEHTCELQKDVWSKFCGPNAPVPKEVECSPYNGEAFREFLVRMEEEMETHIETVDNTPDCEPENAIVCGTFCGEFMMPPDALPCCHNRTSAEREQCAKNKDHRNHSDMYISCFENSAKDWTAAQFGHVAEAKARQAQMRGVLRMLCLIDTFIGGGDHSSKLQECINKDFSSDSQVTALELPKYTAPEMLGKFNCSWWELPGTPEYDEIHYAHLANYTGLYPCPPMDCHESCDIIQAHQDAGVAGNNQSRTLSDSLQRFQDTTDSSGGSR